MITGLGYAGFGSSALEDWRQFGTNLVQVMEGNYKLMSGTCAWWNGVRGNS